MKVAVFGAGSVGGYFGGLLARSGIEVHLIARGDHLDALRGNGLVIRTPSRELRFPVSATDDPASIGPVDVVLFTVKSYDTEAAADQLAPVLRPETSRRPATAVISLQNGIDNEEKIAAAIGWDHVLGGVAYIFASVLAPGVVNQVGTGARLVFGEFGGETTPRVAAFLNACKAAEIVATVVPDIRTALWSKYAFLCAMSGISSAVRLPIGAIRSDTAARELLRAMVDEGFRVATAEGVDMGADYVDRQMSFIDGLDPAGFSSLHRDLTTGHRMELEALHGELIRRAVTANVEVPATRAIYAILSPWARRNQP